MEAKGSQWQERLCHLRPKRASRETSDGKRQSLHREEVATQGEPRKERGWEALGSEVSGILHDQYAPCTQAAHPLENDTTLQGHIRACLLLDLNLPDQPNRHLRLATAKPFKAKTGPVQVVVWEGRLVRGVPIPICIDLFNCIRG